MGVKAIAFVVAVAACAGGRSKTGDGSSGSTGDAGDPVHGAAGSGSAGPATPAGSAEIRVEWKDAPAAVRASPGRNACGVQRRGRARVHTLWGIANAVVIVDLGGAAVVVPRAPPLASVPVMVTVADCALVPPVAVATAPDAIRLYDADPRGHVVAIAPAVALDKLAGAAARLGGKPRRAVLPWLGHEVELAAPEPGAIAIAPADAPDDLAWVVVVPRGLAAVTDDTGLASFPSIPPGTYPLTAWLPPAAGAKGKVVTGEVKVELDKTTKLTIDIAAGTVGTSPPPTMMPPTQPAAPEP